MKRVENRLNVRITWKSTGGRTRGKRLCSKSRAETESIRTPSEPSRLQSYFLFFPSLLLGVKFAATSVGSALRWTGTWRNTLRRLTTTTPVSSVTSGLRSWTASNSTRWRATRTSRPPETSGTTDRSPEGRVNRRAPSPGKTASLRCLIVLDDGVVRMVVTGKSRAGRQSRASESTAPCLRGLAARGRSSCWAGEAQLQLVPDQGALRHRWPVAGVGSSRAGGRHLPGPVDGLCLCGSGTVKYSVTLSCGYFRPWRGLVCVQLRRLFWIWGFCFVLFFSNPSRALFVKTVKLKSPNWVRVPVAALGSCPKSETWQFCCAMEPRCSSSCCYWLFIKPGASGLCRGSFYLLTSIFQEELEM